MQKLSLLLLIVTISASASTFVSGSPSTTNNDDSCDIALLPAATLLLPYFEVDFNSPQVMAKTTLFTIVNTTQQPQIAHVTIWTDWGYPTVDFNVFLTGYDVQAINMYDIFGPRGTIAPPSGTTNEIDPGDRSLNNDANPNFAPQSARDCQILPGAIPQFLLNDIRSAATTGAYNFSCGTTRIGGKHQNATGYVTIDVLSDCTVTLPTEPNYYRELLYDNVLTGDYMWISPNPTTGNYAGGNPLVHIRAIPEGGAAGAVTATDLPRTFYSRYMPQMSRTSDRRQPLPSTFAAHYIQGGPGAFNTDLAIWREAVTGANAPCKDYARNASSEMSIKSIIRFDEHENPTTLPSGCPPILCVPQTVTLPATSSTSAASGNTFPPLSASGDLGGWLWLNLSNSAMATPSQNWVVVSMSAEGRYSVAFDALALSNGCQ